MSNRNFASGGKIYSGHVKPVLLDCNFVVDSTNGNGLGIRNLKGPYIQNVFMHTSVTPGAGASNPATPGVAVINPNPAAGTIIIQFQDNYARAYSGSNAIVSPVGSSVTIDSGLTIGVGYVITVVGDALAADWLAIGVPAGLIAPIAPFVQQGTAFIAKSVGHGASSVSRVAPSAAAGSGILSFETLGDSNQALAPKLAAAQGFGAQIILQARNDASAITAPADGSVISLMFLLGDSSVLVGGE